MKNTNVHRAAFGIGAVVLAALAPDRAAATSVVTEMNPIVIETATQFYGGPTVSTWFMSCVFNSMYEAWQAYDETATGIVTGQRLDTYIGADTPQAREEAVAIAGYWAMVKLAPNKKVDLDAFMLNAGFDINSQTEAAIVGRAAATAMIASRTHDKSNRSIRFRDTTGYAPRAVTILDAWQPLVVNGVTQVAVTPQWGDVTGFALKSGDQFRPPVPAPYGSAAFDEQVRMLIDISANLTTEQKAIAEFWRPEIGTPPMILAANTQQVSELNGFTLEEDVKLFMAIHNAMFDAGIVCWDAKYYYDYLRPVTAVRNLGDLEIEAWGGPGKGTTTILAKDWWPYQPAFAPTPPFPEYTSGHSSFSGSWAEIMERFTGGETFGGGVTIDRLEFEDVDLDPPVELVWPTFQDAAAEAGMSRLYGGIHFMDANLEGQRTGRLAGAQVWQRANAFWEGTAHPAMHAVTYLADRHWHPNALEGFETPTNGYYESGGFWWDAGALAADGPVFGFYETDDLEAPCEGTYELRVYVVRRGTPETGQQLPEARVRIFPTNHTHTWMGVSSPTNHTQSYPEYIAVTWKSDGETPVRIAIDLLAALPNMRGGFEVLFIDNVRKE